MSSSVSVQVSLPKSQIFPSCGKMRPLARSIKVDLPLPFGPTRLTKPDGNSAEKWSNTTGL